VFTFDPDGSYANTYAQQGADRAFAVGLMGWSLTDERFFDALEIAREGGLRIEFRVQKLEAAEHPNAVEVALQSDDGDELRLRANSVGGGMIEFTRIEGWPVRLTGDSYDVLVELRSGAESAAVELLTRDGQSRGAGHCQSREGVSLVWVRRQSPLSPAIRQDVAAVPGFRSLRMAEPVFLVPRGHPIACNAAEFVTLSRERDVSLGRVALEYEAALLGLSHSEVAAEMWRRFEIMREAVRRGLEEPPARMQLLSPSAGKVYTAEADGRVAIGGIHTRAAARAMAAMHVNSGMGVVCAAPTGGAAGTLPGVVVTLAEERGLSSDGAALALLAAGAVGVAVANRATFAAEVAGCQVEIGAAGAMAAAAVVEAAGGSAQQAVDAAAIAFQNTMGSVCDLVQGIVEIPCHTRNAAAAAHAFVCADLVLGGYANPIPLDETIDAVYAVGKMLPPELRCTALGGLAATPSAMAMKPLR
jgi:L-serine dehydratase